MTETRALMLSLVPLFLSLAGCVMANGLLGTVVPLSMREQGYSLSEIGLIGAGYPIGMVLGAQICPLLIGRVGQIRVFAAFGAMAAAAGLILPVLPELYVWMGARVLLGFAMTGLFTIGEAWMNAVATPLVRGRILSTYMAVFYGASVGGQVLLGIVPMAGFMPYAIVTLIFCLSLVPLMLGRIDNPVQPASNVAFSLRSMFKRTITGSLGSFATGMIFGAYGAFGSVFALEIGGSVSFVSHFLMAGMLGAFVLQPIMGRLSDKFDRRWVLVCAIMTVALLASTIKLMAGGAAITILLLNAVMIGLGTCLYSISVALAQDQLNPDEVVKASGALLMFNGLGNVVGPILATPLVSTFGTGGFYTFALGVTVVGTGVFILRALQTRDPVELEEKVDYATLAPTTPLLAELDPRSEPEEEQLEFDFWGAHYTPEEKPVEIHDIAA